MMIKFKVFMEANKPRTDSQKTAAADAMLGKDHPYSSTNIARRKWAKTQARVQAYKKRIQQANEEKHPALKRAGVSGFSKPKRTPGHPTKSHIVVVKDGDKVKTIRFGQQGVSTAGAPKKGESDKQKARRKSFKARHAKNIAKGKTSAAYWADKEKW
jgi:hypothetical protein